MAVGRKNNTQLRRQYCISLSFETAKIRLGTHFSCADGNIQQDQLFLLEKKLLCVSGILERLTTVDTRYIRISLSIRTDDLSVTDSINSLLSRNSNGRVTCLGDKFATWDIQRHHWRAK